MRTVFMGTPSYSIPVLEALVALGYQVAGCYTQPDKPSGRGRMHEQSPVKSFALEHGVRVFQPPSLRRVEVQQELLSLSPDVIIVAAYGKILPPEVLAMPPHGCINVHPSLLPRYRGPSPVATAILDGLSCTGTTVILMDEGMDTGPVLARRVVSIDSGIATTGSLTPLLFQVGGELLKETLPLWMKGEITPQAQDNSQSTVTKKLEKSDGEARWELPAEELERRLRAFTPWPGLFTYWKGRMLKIIVASPIPAPRAVANENASPGLVVEVRIPDIPVGVVTGKGVLGVKGLQLEGRRPINSEEFLRGYRDFLGSTLPS